MFVLLLGGIAALAGGLPSDQGASTAVFIIALVISIGCTCTNAGKSTRLRRITTGGCTGCGRKSRSGGTVADAGVGDNR